MIKISRSCGFRKAAPVCAIALALLPPAAQADDLRDFCANRPGKGSPACILDQGHWQLEGDIFDRASGHGDTTTSLADFQIRYGLTRRTELELSWAPSLSEKTGGTTVHGSGAVILDLRWSVTDPDGKGVAVALQPFVTTPTGSHDFGGRDWSGGIVVPVAMPISDSLSLGLAPALASSPNASGHGQHATWSGAVGISEAVGQVTFGQEFWGAIDDDPAGRTRPASFDLSAAWVPAKLQNTQFDLGYNAGLNRDTPVSEVYLGLAHRF